MGGCIATFFEKYYLIVLFVAIAIVMDVITGIVKAKATGEPLSSKKGTEGLWKKVSLLIALCFGFFLDQFLPYCFNTVGITVTNIGIFGVIIGCYIVLNECISICENLYKINPSILPKWVGKLLNTTKEKIDEMEGDNDEAE